MRWLFAIVIMSVLLVSGCVSQETGPKSNESEPAMPQPEEAECVPDWQCSEWSECGTELLQYRTCTDLNGCVVRKGPGPEEVQECDLGGFYIEFCGSKSCIREETVTFNGKPAGNVVNGEFFFERGFFDAFKEKGNNFLCLSDRFNMCWLINESDFDYSYIPFEMSSYIGVDVWEFITPKEVQPSFDGIRAYFKNDTLYDLERIAKYTNHKVPYRYDELMPEEHWRMPAKILEDNYGDCEDWSNVFVSMALLYGNGLDCYAIAFPEHIGASCFSGNSLYLLSQGGR